MYRRNMIAVCALALCAGTLATPGAIAQQKPLKEQLTGNWTFVSSIDTNKDGTKTDRFGPGAKGLLMLDPSGRFSFLISRANIPKFAAANINQGTAEENKAVMQGMIAYYGTWSVDEPSKILITNVEAPVNVPVVVSLTRKILPSRPFTDVLSASTPSPGVAMAVTATAVRWYRRTAVDVVNWAINNDPVYMPVSTAGAQYSAARSRHTGGVNASMCDGSVRFFSNSVDSNAWKWMGTMNGGEIINNQ